MSSDQFPSCRWFSQLEARSFSGGSSSNRHEDCFPQTLKAPKVWLKNWMLHVQGLKPLKIQLLMLNSSLFVVIFPWKKSHETMRSSHVRPHEFFHQKSIKHRVSNGFGSHFGWLFWNLKRIPGGFSSTRRTPLFRMVLYWRTAWTRRSTEGFTSRSTAYQ